jgi:hypothetical protein
MQSILKNRKTKKQVRNKLSQRGGSRASAADNSNNEQVNLNGVFEEIEAQQKAALLEAQQKAALLEALPSVPIETPIVFPSVKDLPPVPIGILVSLERIIDLKNSFKKVPSIQKILEIYTNLHFKRITDPKSISVNLSDVNTILLNFNKLLVKKKLDNGWRQYIENIIEDNNTNIKRIKIAYKF